MTDPMQPMAEDSPLQNGDGPSGGPKRSLRSGKQIVPSETIAGSTLIFVIAIMAFLACLTLGAVAMISNSAERWQSDVSREVTTQIKPADGQAMDQSDVWSAGGAAIISLPGCGDRSRHPWQNHFLDGVTCVNNSGASL